MKKIKLIMSLGALACATPIITTSCSNNNKEDIKVANVESITWINKDENEVKKPVVNALYAIADAKITIDDEVLDWELIKSITDDGSNEDLTVTQVTETITILPRKTGLLNLKLKLQFYNDGSKKEYTTYRISTNVNAVENYIIASMGDLKDIPNNSTIGVANNDEINFYLGYVPELANIIWSYTTEADPNGEYEFDNGTLTVTTAPAASKEDSLTITAKNGTDTIDQYKIKLQAK